jgi:SAM-dependent methyltransferase
VTEKSVTGKTEVKDREYAHFSSEGVYVISFLENDKTVFGRFLIGIITSFWDRQLDFVRPEWVKGKEVLEAGCGNPRNVLYFESMGAKLAAGCDLNDVMMRRGLATEWAYARGRKMPNQGVVVFAADCENLPLPDSSFDTVFIFQALHHIGVDEFTAEARRVLRPGGILFISDPNGGHPLRRLANMIGRMTRVMSSDEQSWSTRTLSGRIRNAGFDIVQTRSVNLFSELFFLFTVIVETRLPAAAQALRLLLLPLAALDRMLDETLFRVWPRLAWRNIIVSRNGKR